MKAELQASPELKAAYSVTIPLRFLCRPEEPNVAPDKQLAAWEARVGSLLADIRVGVIPSWAVSTEDLKEVELTVTGKEIN